MNQTTTRYTLPQSPHPKRKYAKVCAKHPELRGLRYTCNHVCIGCQRDKRNARAAKKRQDLIDAGYKPISMRDPDIVRQIHEICDDMALDDGHPVEDVPKVRGKYWNDAYAVFAADYNREYREQQTNSRVQSTEAHRSGTGEGAPQGPAHMPTGGGISALD